MTNQPKLSEVLGLKIQEFHKGANQDSEDDWCMCDECIGKIGWNNAIRYLDQLSPDVYSLEVIISNKKQFLSTDKYGRVNFYRELAKEIINSMHKWIKKG